MADETQNEVISELNTIRTTELQLLDISKVVDILVNSETDAGRVLLTDFLNLMNNTNWEDIIGKPFSNIDINYFSVKQTTEGFQELTFTENILTSLDALPDISNSITGLTNRVFNLETNFHTHDNKEIIDLFSITDDNKLSWNGVEVDYKLTPATTEILGGVKPDGETITIDEDGTLHGANTYELPIAAIDTLGGVKVDGDSIAINKDGTIFAVPKGLDFSAIAASMTGGVTEGIEITADESLEVFNFITKIPEIKIDDEGYWTIDDDRGVNPTKAQGESPHIDSSTNHWFIGENDTGVSATSAIDDTSTDGIDVSWSASKIYSIIGDINTVLASVTGVIE